MNKQLSLFDYLEPDVGDYVEKHGAAIPHIMRPAYIGKKVVMDVSTVSHAWYKVGILEKYIPYEGRWRSIVYDGHKQRSLITHYPGVEIYECLEWDMYPERTEKTGGRGYGRTA